MIADIPGGVFFFLAAAAVAMFAFIAVTTWSDSRRREREAFYRSDTLKKIAEMEGSAAARALDFLRDEQKAAARRLRDGVKLGGLITLAAGIGLTVFLRALLADEPVYMVGLIPTLVGAAMLLYSFVLAPKE